MIWRILYEIVWAFSVIYVGGTFGYTWAYVPRQMGEGRKPCYWREWVYLILHCLAWPKHMRRMNRETNRMIRQLRENE